MIKWLRLELVLHLLADFSDCPNIPMLTWISLEPANLYDDANNLAVQGKYATKPLVFLQFKGLIYASQKIREFTVSTWKFLIPKQNIQVWKGWKEYLILQICVMNGTTLQVNVRWGNLSMVIVGGNTLVWLIFQFCCH